MHLVLDCSEILVQKIKATKETKNSSNSSYLNMKATKKLYESVKTSKSSYPSIVIAV